MFVQSVSERVSQVGLRRSNDQLVKLDKQASSMERFSRCCVQKNNIRTQKKPLRCAYSGDKRGLRNAKSGEWSCTDSDAGSSLRSAQSHRASIAQ